MCIIVSKEKGVALPSYETLETCFNHNKDGAGFMYDNNGKVIIKKGFMKYEDFKKAINKLEKEFGIGLENINLVMHFRIGTKGNNDKETTHPFPISNSVKDLKNTSIETDLGVAHNGIIYNYSKDSDLLSDTQHFVKEYLYTLKFLDSNFLKYDSVLNMIKRNCENTKLVFLNNKGELTYIGDFIVENGVKYSNTTYKTYKYSLGWDDDYLYDYYYGNYKSKSYTPASSEKVEDKEQVKEKVFYKSEVLKLNEDYEVVCYSLNQEIMSSDTFVIDKYNFSLWQIKKEFKYTYHCVLIDDDIELYKNFELIEYGEIYDMIEKRKDSKESDK